MKKYSAPEMKTLAFVTEETIAESGSRAIPDGSGSTNDTEFGGW